MSEPTTEDIAVAAAVTLAKAQHAAHAAVKAEEEKWIAKRVVGVAAVATPGRFQDPNAKKFKHYIVGSADPKKAHVLQIGGPHEQIELTERQIFDLKMDPFVNVDDPKDEAQQVAKAKAAEATKAKALEEAKALIAAEEGKTVAPSLPAGVAPSAVDGLSELKEQKAKSKK